MGAFRSVFRGDFLSTIDRHSVPNNPGLDAMSRCICTSDLVVINVDTVYDFVLWCENVTCTFGLTGVWRARTASHLSKHSVVFIYSISSLRQQRVCKSCPISRRDGGNFLWCWISERISGQNPYSAVRPELHRHVQHVTVHPLHSNLCVCQCTNLPFSTRIEVRV